MHFEIGIFGLLGYAWERFFPSLFLPLLEQLENMRDQARLVPSVCISYSFMYLSISFITGTKVNQSTKRMALAKDLNLFANGFCQRDSLAYQEFLAIKSQSNAAALTNL
jgi:hypothetical protein